MRKGIVVSGGTGSRLYPINLGVSKQLLPIFDKPMIFYPLSVLMLSGIQDILLITSQKDIAGYTNLLGDGHRFGLSIQYLVQNEAKGVAHALLLSEEFVDRSPVCLVLGDNVFYGQDFRPLLLRANYRDVGATIFGYHVQNPSDFGVIQLDNSNQPVSIEEKPSKPRSNYAITGLYFYDSEVIDYAKSVQPSGRGELEISDVNQRYLEAGNLRVEILGRGHAWLDTGTPQSLIAASTFVETLESRQGLKIACLEEIAHDQGWISDADLEKSALEAGPSMYGDYLRKLVGKD